jgi:uncharacterized peroxidase-related enzyme
LLETDYPTPCLAQLTMNTSAAPNEAVACFDVPALTDLPEDIRERLLATQTKAGFIPNVMRVLARRPAEFRAFMAYHDALMDGESGLSKAEREMIVVATSGANHCLYCVVAHGAILRIRAKNTTIADQVAINYRQADLTERQRAMLDFAMKVSRDAANLSNSDRQAARQAGLTGEDLWDIASIAAFFAMSNRLASATDMKPNAEFYSMGR